MSFDASGIAEQWVNIMQFGIATSCDVIMENDGRVGGTDAVYMCVRDAIFPAETILRVYDDNKVKWNDEKENENNNIVWS